MYIKIGTISLILSIPLAFVVPPEITFENNLIENLQVAFLILFAVFNAYLLLTSRKITLKWYHLFCAALFVLFALRELSWGRVFFPIGIEDSGAQIFISMADFPYKIQVHIFIVIYSLMLLAILFRFLPVKKILFKQKPIGALTVMFGAILLAYIGEHGYLFGKEIGEVLEELDELIAYLMLPKICLYYREFLKSN